MASKNKNLDTKINVCYMAYKPTVTESDVDDLVSFIVIVAQEGFKTLKVAQPERKIAIPKNRTYESNTLFIANIKPPYEPIFYT